MTASATPATVQINGDRLRAETLLRQLTRSVADLRHVYQLATTSAYTLAQAMGHLSCIIVDLEHVIEDDSQGRGAA